MRSLSHTDDLRPHGPRYIQFHPAMPIAYVVNELSSTVAVFKFDREVAKALSPDAPAPTMTHVQTISTIPSGSPCDVAEQIRGGGSAVSVCV